MNALDPRRTRFFYGYYVAGAGFGVQMLLGTLAFHSFGTYVALMEDDFGWGRATFAWAFAMQRAESGILGPIQGWMIDRFGPRNVMMAGLVLMSAGFFSLSQVHSLWTFYASYMAVAVGASLAGFLALVVSLVNWFRRRRSLALSIISVGFAMGGILATPVAIIIEGVGWRTALVASGFIVLALGIPLAMLVRHRPEEYGLLPDGDVRATGDDEDAEEEEGGLTTRQALREPAFWLISFGQAAALLVVGALMVHLVIYIHEDLEYGLALAAFAVTLQTIGQLAGQVIGAYVGDRLPKRPPIAAAMVCHTVAILMLALVSTLPLIYLAVFINGIGWGLRGVLQTAIRADYFGRRDFGKIMGFSSMIIMLGMMTGPVFAGFMYDRSGNYETGFLVLAAFAGLGSVLFMLAKPPASMRGGPPAIPVAARTPAGPARTPIAGGADVPGAPSTRS